jgi:hypothetical protein
MTADRRQELLIDELKQAVGEGAVERTDLDVEGALERQPSSRLLAAFRSARLPLLVIGGALLVAGVIASLALESWVFFGLALAAHALVATVVIASALALTHTEEKPSPTAEAALEEEGVSNPGAALDDLVDQVGSRRSRPS